MAASTSSLGSRPLGHGFFAVVALFTLFLSFAGARNGLSHTRLHGIHATSRDITSSSKNNDISIREDPLSKNFLRRDVTGQAGGSSSSSSTDYTCGPGKPCSNGACCGVSGWCGYNATYCGTGCQSNCDAKAECGEYAATPGQKCPINVCCSEFGFCGTTSDFCGTGCQSNCNQPKPSVSASDVQQKIIAYYEGWNTQHTCGTMEPEEIPVEKLTHLIAAFGYITPNEFLITNMDGVSPDIYQRLTNTKQTNPNLKVMVALGGWSFTDPGEFQSVFPTLVSTEANRALFISNLLGFLSQYGFDGVDFDWEYPGADDRGGSADDGVNFTSLLKELRAAVDKDPHNYIITFTAPTSYWYLRHFDITAMTQYADWINLMAYDLHGVWDSNDPIGNQVLAHTNLTEIDLALDLYWRNDIPPSKIVLGLGFYGRSFQLEDSSCYQPGCAFSGAGEAGPCTATAGILSYKEITDILSKTGATPYYDEVAAVNYLVYGGNSWISYDNAKSYQAKIDYANKQGLSGLMVWAVDQDNTNHDALNAISPIGTDSLQFEEDGGASVAHSSGDLSSCKVTENCGQQCDEGWTAMTRVGTLGSEKRCPTNNFRYVCCPSFAAPDPSTCYWNMARSTSGLNDCNGGCTGVGDVTVVGDSWGWVGPVFTGKAGDVCTRGGVTYCCPAGNMQQYLDICTWSTCGGDCPSDKPYIQTTDVGGASSQSPSKTCPSKSYLDSIDHDKYYYDYEQRKLCCPSSTSLKNCNWHNSKECSEACPDNQIEFDQDAGGTDGKSWCSWGRTQKYCCDPPGGANLPFTVADLDTLFPPAYLPPAGSVPQYDLVSFGGLYTAGGIEDPNASGVAFILFAGDTTILSRMKKRDGSQMGIEFLDCPDDVRSLPRYELRSARVICLGEDINDCFPVLQGGVEGTLVSMPEECGSGFARAVSLEYAENQSIPRELMARNPTSAVFTFSFDYDMPKIRRDAGSLSMRVDYSNAGGYWDAIVKSPGVAKRELDDRYFSSSNTNWANKFEGLTMVPGDAKVISQTVSDLVYFQYSDSCSAGNNGSVPEGLAISTDGSIDLKLWYGYSMVGTISGGALTVHEANGFVEVSGQTDMTFEISGLGIFDATSGGTTSQPLNSTLLGTSLGGHAIMNDWITFDPFVKTGYTLGTTNSAVTEFEDNSISWNGYANARMVTTFGQGIQPFPAGGPQTSTESKDTMETGKAGFPNDIDANWVTGGDIGITHIVDAGLAVSMALPQSVASNVGKFPTMTMHSETSAVFLIDNSTVAGEACLDVHMGKVQTAEWTDGSFVGWPSDQYGHTLESYISRVGSPTCFDKTTTSSKKRVTCSGGSSSSCQPPFGLFQSLNYLAGQGAQSADAIFKAIGQSNMVLQAAEIISDSSWYCENTNEDEAKCCGCIDLDTIYGPDNAYTDPDFQTDTAVAAVSKRQLFEDFSNLDLNSDRDNFDASADFEKNASAYSVLEERLSRSTPGGVYLTTKDVTFCQAPKVVGPFYPSYPKPSRNIDWPTVNGNAYSNVLIYDRSSESCSDWDTQVLAWPGRTAPGAATTAAYDTEHVFEGQSIGDFFSNYIQYGLLPWFTDLQKVPTGDANWDCNWVANWVTHRVDATWDLNGVQMTFATRVLQELGSVTNLDRLVVFPQRPNIDKGAIFGGTPPYTALNFGRRSPQAQLLTMKELGMAFTYMNIPAVVNAFCATYEGIYTLMGEFDTWYPTVNPGQPVPGLQAKWQTYVRDLLDNAVVFSHTTALSWWFSIDWQHMDPFYNTIWQEVASHEAAKMNFQNVMCTHLAATTLPATGFLSNPI